MSWPRWQTWVIGVNLRQDCPANVFSKYAPVLVTVVMVVQPPWQVALFSMCSDSHNPFKPDSISLTQFSIFVEEIDPVSWQFLVRIVEESQITEKFMDLPASVLSLHFASLQRIESRPPVIVIGVSGPLQHPLGRQSRRSARLSNC